MSNTKLITGVILNKLMNQLKKSEFKTITSIYVCGSYCRGDWLNKSSDLDIHAIYKTDCLNDFEDDKKQLNDYINNAREGIEFPSHCPGGVDIGYNSYSYVPKTYGDACKQSAYAYFSTLMFDLKKYSMTLYGEDIRNILPYTLNTKDNSYKWLLFLRDRIYNVQENDFKMSFIAYKAVLAAQLFFGEETINKYKILDLYQQYIPDFSSKWVGEIIIRNYLGSYYPERPSQLLDKSYYMEFLDNVIDMIG